MSTRHEAHLRTLGVVGLTSVLWVTPAGAQPKPVVRLSVSTSGEQANGDSALLAVSRDHRFVLFRSVSTNLVSDDTNGTQDLFVRDRDIDRDGIFDEPGAVATIRVSVGTNGEQADRPVNDGMLTPDGRFVLFTTDASTLVPGDTNQVADVFVRDRDPDGNGIFDEPGRVSTTRSSEGPGGVQGDAASTALAMTPDGRFVLFSSASSTFSSSPVNGVLEIYRKDRQTGALALVTRSADGLPADGESYTPTLSDDGRIVAFTSQAGNLGGGPSGTRRVYVRDLATDTIRNLVPLPVPHYNSFLSYNEGAYPGVAPDGRTVFFSTSYLNWLGTATYSNDGDLFAFDLQTGVQLQVASGTNFRFASNGRGVLFERAYWIPLGCAPHYSDLFRFDGITGETVLLTRRQHVTASTSGSLRRVLIASSSATNCALGVNEQRMPTQSLIDTAYGDVPVVMPAPVRPGFMNEAGSEVISAEIDRDILGPPIDSNGVLDVFAVDIDSRLDQDADGLDDRWEAATGLLYSSAAGPDGANGDPDGDGVNNIAEFQQGTHPRGTVTRYLAEGAQNTFFHTRIALSNPGTALATTVVRLLGDNGLVTSRLVPLTPQSRRTLDLAEVEDLPSASFSIVVESDAPVGVERTMTWDATNYGGHSEQAVPATSKTWFFAEGSTTGDFALFYLLANPNTAPATATIRYLRPAGAPPIERSYLLPAMSRRTVYVNAEVREFASSDLAAVITADQPIVAERSMYLTRDGSPFAAGHVSAGATAPATTWYFAEGATGPFFDLFLLIANPTETDAIVNARYLLGSGDVLTKTYTLPANSRVTIWANGEDFPGAGRALASGDVSTILTSTNGVPIVAERAMWFPSPAFSPEFWTEAHDSFGATATATKWIFGAGEEGGPDNAQSFVLVTNTSPYAADVHLTVLVETAAYSPGRWFVLPPNSRTTIPIRAAFPDLADSHFGLLVESGDSTPFAQLIVERSTYWDAAGSTWAAGTNVLGTPIP